MLASSQYTHSVMISVFIKTYDTTTKSFKRTYFRQNLLIIRSQVRFLVLPWEFSPKGRIPTVTMVWVG